jgi:SAM-dependent methyltransferase
MRGLRLMPSRDDAIWESKNEAKLLESRLAGFWNPDYLQRIILPMLNLKPGARVLDVGCGSGSLTFVLARLVPNIHIVGVDITPALVDAARARATEVGLTNVDFHEADARRLPFADSAFDSVVCQTALAFVTEPAGVVQEMSRVLAEGGTFMAAEYHTLNTEWPIDDERLDVTDTEAAESAKYLRLLICGFRKSGQGDLRIGGKVPFLARRAGLTVIDVRISDHVPHAFPPSPTDAQHAARAEARACVETYADVQWREWVTNAMTAGGGTSADVDRFLSLLLDRQRNSLSCEAENYAFLWLINPVLLLTIAQKQGCRF